MGVPVERLAEVAADLEYQGDGYAPMLVRGWSSGRGIRATHTRDPVRRTPGFPVESRCAGLVKVNRASKAGLRRSGIHRDPQVRVGSGSSSILSALLLRTERERQAWHDE